MNWLSCPSASDRALAKELAFSSVTTIQTHNSSITDQSCYWRLNEVIPQLFKVIDQLCVKKITRTGSLDSYRLYQPNETCHTPGGLVATIREESLIFRICTRVAAENLFNTNARQTLPGKQIDIRQIPITTSMKAVLALASAAINASRSPPPLRTRVDQLPALTRREYFPDYQQNRKLSLPARLRTVQPASMSGGDFRSRSIAKQHREAVGSHHCANRARRIAIRGIWPFLRHRLRQ